MTKKSSLVLASALLCGFALVTPLTRARARVNEAKPTVPTATTSPARDSQALSWQKAAEDTFELGELTIARRVVERKALETIDEGGTIVADGGRIFAYLTAFNKGKARRLEVIWQRGDQVFHQQSVTVGRAPSWRTWAFLDARPRLVGGWTVTVRDEKGAELASRRFNLVAAK